MGHRIFFFLLEKRKSYCRHRLLERIMHAFDTFSFLQDGVTLAQNSPSWRGGGVSVSLVLFMHSLEDNRSTYFDLTFSESVVQETGIEWYGLKLIIMF